MTSNNIRTFSDAKEALVKKTPSKQLLFSKDEVEDIFNPQLLKNIFEEKAQRDQKKQKEERKSYTNTEDSKHPSPAKQADKEHKQEKLKSKIEQEKEKYDFKFIKRKLTQPTDDKKYIDEAQLDRAIRQPHIQKSADDMLNLFQNHQFSFSINQALDLYKRIGRAIPAGVQEGGDMAGSTHFKFRNRDDPRYTDRRMQNLLRKLETSIDEFSPKQLNQLLHCTVKLRFPEDKMIQKVINKLMENSMLKVLTPQETALCLWSLVRLKITDTQIISKIKSKVRFIVQTVHSELYLYDSQDQDLSTNNDEILEKQIDFKDDREPMVEYNESISDKESQENSNDQVQEEDEEHPAGKPKIEAFLNQQTIAMFWWGLASLKVGKCAVYSLMLEILASCHSQLSLQTIAMLLSTQSYIKGIYQTPELLEFGLSEAFLENLQLQPSQIVHVKIIIRSLARTVKNLDSNRVYCERLAKLIVKMEKFTFKDKRKRTGVVSNYCQIMHGLTVIKAQCDMKIYKDLYDKILYFSHDLSDCINPRDFQELVFSMCRLHHNILNGIQIENKDCIKMEKELRILAKRSALMMSSMTPRSRDIVFDSFQLIDFYDVDLIQGFKQFKMIQ